jgi:hypothetical protein
MATFAFPDLWILLILVKSAMKAFRANEFLAIEFG